MSNFWATKLGVQQAPAAPQPQPAAPRAWYDLHTPPVAPQAPAQPQAQPEQQGWGSVEKSMQKAQSARLTDRCPNCNSTNYFRAAETPNAMQQCRDCGFNPRFSQMGGAGGLPSGSSAAVGATPARQIEGAGLGGTSQYRPDIIVGRA